MTPWDLMYLQSNPNNGDISIQTRKVGQSLKVTSTIERQYLLVDDNFLTT
jgi:hypothetical protein